MDNLITKLWLDDNNKNTLSENIVFNIIKELNSRSGFDSWFDDIDAEIQEEILEELIKITELGLK